MRLNFVRLSFAATLAALAAFAIGCGSSTSPTAPGAMSQTDADDLALQVGATLAAGNGGMLGTLAPSAQPTAARPAPAGAFAASAAAAETTFTVGGITWHLVRTFYNADGGEMEAFDPVLTTRIVTQTTARGAIETLHYQAGVGHASALVVHGVSALNDMLRFNGVSRDTCQSQFSSLEGRRTRHFYMESAGALNDVLWLKPILEHPWPISGTAVWQVKADRLRSNERADVEAHLDATVTVTFNGTQYARVEVTGGWKYTLNLLTGELARGASV